MLSEGQEVHMEVSHQWSLFRKPETRQTYSLGQYMMLSVKSSNNTNKTFATGQLNSPIKLANLRTIIMLYCKPLIVCDH